MKHKLKNWIVFLAMLILVVALGIVFAMREKNILPSIQADSVEVKNVAPDNDVDINQTTKTEVAAEKDILKNLSMPILMYHHIRDFNDPNDQIGINLSVSPQKFADQLDLIKSKGYTTITFSNLETGNIPTKPIVLTFDDGYKNFYQNAYPELKKRGMVGTVFVITQDIGKDQYMDEKEIKEINANGIEIGSHTLSHPDLSKLSSDRAEKEISNSKKTLESLTDNQIISFCYPSGKFSEETTQILKNASYKYAVTTKSKLTTFENLFELNRYRVNSDTNISGFLK